MEAYLSIYLSLLGYCLLRRRPPPPTTTTSSDAGRRHMGIGFTVGCKRWALPIHTRRPFNPCARQLHQRASPFRSKEASSESGRSTPLLILEETESMYRDTSKASICLHRALHNVENVSSDATQLEENIDRKPSRYYCNLKRPAKTMEDSRAHFSTMTGSNSPQFSLMMENLNKLEDIFAGADLVMLEGDILLHMGRLGALKLFHACLSRTSMESASNKQNFILPNYFGDFPEDSLVGEKKGKIIVRTEKKEKRKARRNRASYRVASLSKLSVSSKKNHKAESSSISLRTGSSSPMVSSKFKRVIIARSESEMSRGVKEVAELERTQSRLKLQLGRRASYARWAEAAGIDQETLQQRLQFGWQCREKLLRSTQSLVVYLAKNYRGMGIAFDDILQAGNIGVLKGAERFDSTRGYRFSTYVQYWIKKSILALISRHSRGIQIPVRMEKVIRQIKKARKTFSSEVARYPQDEEIAALIGVSLANVRLADKCSRAVGSIEQEMGDGWSTKFMEATPDASVKAPVEVVMNLHMRNDIFELVEGLCPREKQVLMLRYGLDDGRCRSLQEIGRIFHVSKEWIRQIEKTALTKIRRGDARGDLKYYIRS